MTKRSKQINKNDKLNLSFLPRGVKRDYGNANKYARIKVEKTNLSHLTLRFSDDKSKWKPNFTAIITVQFSRYRTIVS